jgi:hypothetical protein
LDDAAQAKRQLHPGATLEGVGADHSSWLDPDLPADARIESKAVRFGSSPKYARKI